MEQHQCELIEAIIGAAAAAALAFTTKRWRDGLREAQKVRDLIEEIQRYARKTESGSPSDRDNPHQDTDRVEADLEDRPSRREHPEEGAFHVEQSPASRATHLARQAVRLQQNSRTRRMVRRGSRRRTGRR